MYKGRGKLDKKFKETRKDKIIVSYKYIMNQWELIEIYETEGKYLNGCSA